MKVETLKDSYQLSSVQQELSKAGVLAAVIARLYSTHSSGGRPGSSSAKTRKEWF